MKYRIEKDFLGSLQIPNTAYYGVQTMRAAENFKITGISLSINPIFINSLAYVKKAAALANNKLELLDKTKTKAIVHACDEIVKGGYYDQFIVDMLQGGAGTSTNMNANEVIANIANEKLGGKKGEYKLVHPNNDVNMSQSTNDAYPTAFRIALYLSTLNLLKTISELKTSMRKKEKEGTWIFPF